MIYLDNAATTKTHEDVVKEMLPYFTENYGNASTQWSGKRENFELSLPDVSVST